MKKEVKGEKRTIFELTDESMEGNYQKPEDENTGNPKDFLEKLHIRNHELNSLETIHELYREEKPEIENDTDLLSEEDEYLFREVEKAVAEKDILDLRANLQSISKTVPGSQLKTEDIEKYLDGDLDPQEYELIQKELKSDLYLADEMALYTEIDEAIAENDIMQLRSDLRAIILDGSSHSRKLEEIDDYVSGELEEPLKNSFEEEIFSNQNLAAEVRLFNEINEAIGEKDVMDLRTSLTSIGKDANSSEIRGLRNYISFPLIKKFWYIVAAFIVIFLGINIFFHTYSNSNSKIYNEFYKPAEGTSGTIRSATNAQEQMIDQAFTMMSIKEYGKALKLFSDILDKDNSNPAANFYAGTIYQMKGMYTDAIQAYNKVIEQGDNLFIEQADWYLGLCYLKVNQHDKAVHQFRRISRLNGYYCQQSVSILKILE